MSSELSHVPKKRRVSRRRVTHTPATQEGAGIYVTVPHYAEGQGLPELPSLEGDTRMDITNILKVREKDKQKITRVVAFAKHITTGTPVVLKFFMRPQDLRADADEYTQEAHEEASENFERFHYETRVYDMLSHYPQMPNFVRSLGSMSIPPEKMNKRVMAQIMRNADDLMPVEVVATITEHRPAVKSYDDIRHTLSHPQRRSLAFQLIYTLAFMHSIGLQHNDLHSGNILVDMNPPETSITYMTPGHAFEVPMHGLKVLLFDWDLAYHRDLGGNAYLDDDFCPRLGICNELNARVDVFTALTDMYSGGDFAFRAFVDDVLGATKIHQNMTGRMCNAVKQEGKTRCIPFPAGQPKTVSTPLQALQQAYFRPFHRK